MRKSIIQRIFTVAATMVLAAVMAGGCGSSGTQMGSKTGAQTSSVEDVLAQGMAAADGAESGASEVKAVVTPESYSEKSDSTAGEATDTSDMTEDETTDVSAASDTDSQSDWKNIDESTLGETPDNVVLSTTEGIDIDLTSLSSTMVYSEVYNMMYYPENYIGKIVRMNGAYSEYHDEASGNDYYACIISDATACCAQGIEFIPTENYSYPADFPSDGDEVIVVGEFDTYKEGENLYCTLRNASME